MTVVIPTLGREEILVATIRAILQQNPEELLIIDQTPAHQPATEKFLCAEHKAGKISWLRLNRPSIPHAMNMGLLKARGDWVLFLDDDIEASHQLLIEHKAAQRTHPEAHVVIGQILQPGEIPKRLTQEETFQFYSDSPGYIYRAMAGNMSVHREHAIELGGFDENFLGAAYMFETEFAERVMRSGGRIFFAPGASIRHLRAPHGGTRSGGSHFETIQPLHASGAYYHLLLTWGVTGSLLPALGRFFSSVYTRYHLKHPWRIPVTLIAEMRGMLQGMSLFHAGPQLLRKENIS